MRWNEDTEHRYKRVTRATIEHKLAESGRAPRGCYAGSLFGCASFERLVTMCLVCPWRNWKFGDAVPPLPTVEASLAGGGVR